MAALPPFADIRLSTPYITSAQSMEAKWITESHKASTERCLAMRILPWPMSLVEAVRATSPKQLTARGDISLPLRTFRQKMNTTPCDPKRRKTMDLRILKPLDRTTAVLEIWDGEVLIAEVFARQDGVRRFHLSKEAAVWGPHWEALSKIAAQTTVLLDVADEEMRQARQNLSGR